MVGAIATYFPEPHRPSDRETRMVELYARQAAAVHRQRAALPRDPRGRPPQGRVPGDARARAAQPPGADPERPAPAPRAGRRPDAAEQAREVAERQVRHLARLVDDLLDVSRISSGKIQLRKGRVELREAVARAVETARPADRGPPPRAVGLARPTSRSRSMADAARLEQVLANLLNNAAKYTEPGGRIALEAGREGDDAVVRVRDNGIGIAPTCSRASSTCSPRPTARSTAARGGSGSA